MSKSGKKRTDLGSYAINSETGCPWIGLAETPRCAQRLRQSKPSVKVTNILFDQMTEYVDDSYWIGVFKRMSTGRMPKSFKMVGPELVYRKRGGKTLSLLVPKQPEKVGEVIDFFHQCGIYSHTDEVVNTKIHQSRVANYVPRNLQWGNISRNRLLLDQALVAFADKKVQEAGLGDDSFLELFQLLKMAAVLGVLTSANVVVQNDAIEDVKVLSFDKTNGVWDINFNVARKRKPKAKPREKVSIATLWKNYLEVVVGKDPAAEPTPEAATPETTTFAESSNACEDTEVTELEETTELE